ncbi:MAG TPA: hypothetical protein VF876_19125 [Burkholderiales bacterium]
MRTKEEAHDYRYFPDPDLLPLVVTDDMLERARKSMPKFKEELRAEFIKDYGLTAAQAQSLTTSRAVSTYALSAFENLPKTAVPGLANWITGPLSARLNRDKLDIEQAKVGPQRLRELYELVASGDISASAATGPVLIAMWDEERSAREIVDKLGLRQISDSGAIERIVDEVLAKNAKQVDDYRAGKEKAFNSLVGQVMKATQGKANPGQVNAILKAKLAAR